MKSLYRQTQERYLVRFYNQIAQADAQKYEDIPPEVQEFLSHLDHEHIVTPFIAQDLQDKKGSRDHLAKVYEVGPEVCRNIGRKLCIFSKPAKKIPGS